MTIKDYLKSVYRWAFRSQRSYSQTGEDLIANFYLPGITKGFYVDVGTNDPIYLNNTYLFYKKAWRGICVEPNVHRCQVISLARPGDTVLNVGVDRQPSEKQLYVFNPDTIATFLAEEAEIFKKLGHTVEKVVPVKMLPLSAILAEHANGRDIDILSVDTEGFDMHVLESNDWERFRPKIVIVEVAEYRGKTMVRTHEQFDNFFAAHNYFKLADTYINGLYMEKEYARATNLLRS